MMRRDFLEVGDGGAAGAGLPAAPAVWSPAKAQARQETLLIVSESGPNNLNVHGHRWLDYWLCQRLGLNPMQALQGRPSDPDVPRAGAGP